MFALLIQSADAQVTVRSMGCSSAGSAGGVEALFGAVQGGRESLRGTKWHGMTMMLMNMVSRLMTRRDSACLRLTGRPRIGRVLRRSFFLDDTLSSLVFGIRVWLA